MQKALSISIFVLSAFVGLGAILYPLIRPGVSALSEVQAAVNPPTPALTLVLLVITLGMLILEAQGQVTNAKTIAALGVLIAATSVLRFIEVAIPGPGGFSPIFVPVILAGYVFGGRFGFLMGTLTMLVSAILTGGIGPWLPYQMLTAGWIGLTAGLLPELKKPIWLLGMLSLFAFTWGILYGVILNLYFWPFIGTGVTSNIEPVTSVDSTLVNYGAFYLATSLIWDLTRATGNAVLILVLGLPTIQALQRFRDKFQFRITAQ